NSNSGPRAATCSSSPALAQRKSGQQLISRARARGAAPRTRTSAAAARLLRREVNRPEVPGADLVRAARGLAVQGPRAPQPEDDGLAFAQRPLGAHAVPVLAGRLEVDACDVVEGHAETAATEIAFERRVAAGRDARDVDPRAVDVVERRAE